MYRVRSAKLPLYSVRRKKRAILTNTLKLLKILELKKNHKKWMS